MGTRDKKPQNVLFHIPGTTSTTLRNIPHPSVMLNEAELGTRRGDFLKKFGLF